MQNLHKVLNSVSIMSVVTLAIALASLMFLSYFLTSLPPTI